MTKPFSVVISFVPHAVQRYDTVGDWYFDGGRLVICVSQDHPDYTTAIEQEAVALHELTEALLCYHAGVTQKMVDDFDFAWTDGKAEPGDCNDAPYFRQHQTAEIVERIYIQEATSYDCENHKEK